MSIQSIDKSLIYYICSNLTDRDVKSLGVTSKAIGKVAQWILQQRDERLKEILSFYTPTRMFNIQSLEQADLFLVGDVHENLECTENQNSLINLLAKRGIVFLSVEEDESEFTNTLKEQWFENRGIVPQKNILLSGWDTSQTTIGKIIASQRTSITKNTIRAVEITKNRVRLLDQFKLCKKNEELQQMMTNLLTLDQESKKLMHKIRKATITIEFLFKPEDIFRIFNDEADIETYREKYAIGPQELQEYTAQDYPQRTASMVQSLRKFREKKLECCFANPKGVWIPGNGHLEQAPEDLDDERFNLDSLYDELKHHRAVILMPTRIMAEYQQRRRTTQAPENGNIPEKN